MNEEINISSLKRWRLILGEDVNDKLNSIDGSGDGILSNDEIIMDNALAAIYDNTNGEGAGYSGKAGLGPSYPNIAKWLSDIRSYFPDDVVSIIQNDAIERKGLTSLIFEPETLRNIKPDINMVSTLLSLKGHIPKKAKEQARALVNELVKDIMKQMENDLRKAVTGAINRRKHSPIPSLPNTDWKKTIIKNLKNYDIGRKQIIPEKFYFFENKRLNKEWNIIIDIDQSGSMMHSIIYSSIMGCIFASMPAIETRVVAFDTKVVDLTETCGSDPVDMLFGIQLGGGTDINKSVRYCSEFIHTPKKTLFILVSDLYEGGVEAGLLRQLNDMKESGVIVLILMALSDEGKPMYNESLGKKINKLDIPCFACTPNKLPELIGSALKGKDLNDLVKNIK